MFDLFFLFNYILDIIILLIFILIIHFFILIYQYFNKLTVLYDVNMILMSNVTIFLF